MAAAPLHVLIVVIDLAGGTGTFCRNLAAGLKKFYPGEFKISLLLLGKGGMQPPDAGLFDEIRIIERKVHQDFRRWYETPLHYLAIRKTLRESPADLIFTVGAYANLLAGAAADRPVILSVHTHSRQLANTRFGRITSMLMKRRYGRHTVVVPVEGVAEDLKQNFGVQRVCTIYHGVDADSIRALAARPADDFVATAPCIAACGRLTLQKDYPTLIRAYADARAGGLTHDLLIIGEGEQRAELQRLITSLSLEQFVHVVGHKDNPFPYMARASFFVLSSIWEGFGLVLLEAMALGLPCISTRCPSGPEEILASGKFGRLVPPGDVAALSAAITDLAASADDQRELHQLSLQRAAELSLASMARQYRELFLQEIQSWKSKPA